MEFKVVVYIIMGIVYFIYSMKKKVDEQKSVGKEKPTTVNPPVSNPIEEILAEMKKRQDAAQHEAKKQVAKPVQSYTSKPVAKMRSQPVSSSQKKVQRDVLVHEKKVSAFEEGKSSYESVFERELTEEEKIERGNLKIANEGIYKTESIDEMEKREASEATQYVLNAREAFIGSLVFERKF
ncbi:MAG: hypothetical protein IPN22_13330 [Bacteroidetes bacterium]|nr:hypothetical protein [Bacteroidota bacterium]